MTGKNFMREKKIKCGDRYREIDIFPYTKTQKEVAERGKGKRSKLRKESEPKQKNLNDKNARRYLTQLAHMNFFPKDLHVTATYNEDNLPDSIEAAEKEVMNFLRRIQYRRKKDGLPALKYIIVTAYGMGRNNERDKPVRIHHHIIMNGGLDRDSVENLWRKRKEKGQKAGTPIGFINADRLQFDETGITALCNYLARNPGGKKRWSSSHNLSRPHSRTNDHRYNRTHVQKIAEKKLGRDFWEEQYPGWTLTDDAHGVTYEWNDKIGWAIYLKLRKKE